jgi:hypothetical protein
MNLKRLIPLLCTVLVGCGEFYSQQFSTNDTYVETSIGSIDPLIEVPHHCEDSGLLTGKFFTEYFFQGFYQVGKYKPVIQNYQVRTSAVNSSLYKGHFELFSGRKLQKASPKKISICSSSRYSSDSYAGSYLHVSKYLDEAYQAHKNIRGDISQVNLWIAPKIEVKNFSGQSEVIKYYQVNNAAYVPSTNTIIFYPKGRVGRQPIPFNGVAFWQIPMVIGHEYGHHVFSEIFYPISRLKEAPKIDEKTRLEQEASKLCFDSSEGHQHFKMISDGSFRFVDHATVIGAINEGFADLFAFYAIGKKKNNLKKIDLS